MRALPFAIVAGVGQVSGALPPGPSDVGLYWWSIALVVVAALAALSSPPMGSRRLLAVGAYVASVTCLMLATGGTNSGLGALLLIPVVAMALYGRRWESAAAVVGVIVSLLVIPLAGPHIGAVTERRALLFGFIAITLSVAIHTLRERLVEANARTTRLLRQAEALNAAARELTSLLDPGAISSLGVELAAQIACPPGREPRRALYLRVQEGLVYVDARFDESGGPVDAHWLLEEKPPLKRAVETKAPVRAEVVPGEMGPSFQPLLEASGVTHGAWVPVCPDGDLHGVLAIAGRGAPVSDESFECAVALGHLLELALSNWFAHQRLEEQATAEERRRIARELHDGLAHELAFIASRSRRSATSSSGADGGELAQAAYRALDEARRAITVLSTASPQSLPCAVAQTAEDLAARLGIDVALDLADDVNTPGEVTENVLRIVREAITNAANHGNPSHVTVRLRNADGVRLVVEDDGCGFDPDDPGRRGGFGLVSMRERAASIGATLHVDSSVAEGTRVEVALT